ncbi:MAG: ParA family protein [Chloroflexi bacterium]|nr:ParA family protein [Chloroflexota bacterium]
MTFPPKTIRSFTQIKPGVIISLAVEKGGAGKTTSAVNIASGLARWGANLGWRVLLIDIDPQGTASNAVGQFSAASSEKTLAKLLDDDHLLLRPHEFIAPSPWNPKHLHYIPTNRQTLGGMREKLISKIGRERRLSRVLNPLRSDYHFVIIDTGPVNDVLTQNALVASDFVLIPINLDFLGLEAINRTFQLIKVIQLGLEQERPKILGLLGTFYRKGVLASEEALKMLNDKFSNSVIRTVIPLNSAIPDSFSAGVDIYTFNRYSPGATAYNRVVHEILIRIKKIQEQRYG